MEGDKQHYKLDRRLVLFPAPLQGHVTPMLHLADVLHTKGFSITIVHTLFNPPDCTKFPHLNFQWINDGLSDKHAPLPPPTGATMYLLNASCAEPFRECLSLIAQQEPIACLIADPMWRFAEAVAESFNIPRIALRTGGMSSFLVYHYLPLLQEKGYFPLQDVNLEETLLEFAPLKVKDLPSEPLHDILIALVRELETSRAIICNTFEELEGSALAKIRELLPIPIFPIGPLHSYASTTSGDSLSAQDKGVISWLSTQPLKSVLYVSFGSIATLSEADFQEVAWGLANSKQPFLWVVRPGLIKGSEANNLLPDGFLDGVSSRGCIVQWAPQQEVLAHPAVGVFWTHCGWNSVLESISNGVPMICLPFFADQAMNARYVSDSWKIGLQLGREIRRGEIERAVRQLLVEEEGEEIRKRVITLKEKATLCKCEGNSSYKALEELTGYLSSL